MNYIIFLTFQDLPQRDDILNVAGHPFTFNAVEVYMNACFDQGIALVDDHRANPFLVITASDK